MYLLAKKCDILNIFTSKKYSIPDIYLLAKKYDILNILTSQKSMILF